MLTRENEGSKKSVRKVVQDFVHQQYNHTIILHIIYIYEGRSKLLILLQLKNGRHRF